jgi:hypothetical protein
MDQVMTKDAGAEAQPINPYLILLAAILLPGFGHVLCGEPRRGFTMQMFMIALGIVTWQLAAPDRSIIGKLAGGLFIYAISVVDAYTIARRRWAEFHQRQSSPR